MRRNREEYLKALQKRWSWLEARIATAADAGRQLSHDEREAAALKWAIALIKESRPELRDVEYEG